MTRIQWQEIAIGVFLTVLVAVTVGGKPAIGIDEDGCLFMGVVQ